MEQLLVRARVFLIALAVWMALTNALVWAGSRSGSYARTHFDIPVGPQRAIHVHIGDRLQRDFYGYPTGEAYAVQPIFKPLRVALRYRIQPGWQGRQLLVAYLPTWPLAPLALGLAAMALLTLWPANRLIRPSHAPTARFQAESPVTPRNA